MKLNICISNVSTGGKASNYVDSQQVENTDN